MTPPRLAPPEPIELVSADELSALVAATDGAFQHLETRAAEATAAADHAEARANALGLDDQNAPAAMEAMQRFIAGWRAEVEAHASSLVDAARLGARVRVDEAHAEAERVRRARRNAPVVAPPTPPVDAPALVTPLSEPTRDIAPEPVDVPDNRTEVQSVVLPELSPEVAPVAEVAPPSHDELEPLTPLADSPGPAEAPTVASEMGALDESVLFGARGANGTSTLDAMAPEEAADDTAVRGDESTGTFWTEPPPPKRKGILRRIPVSAVLEVIAVLMILVFILLRLS